VYDVAALSMPVGELHQREVGKTAIKLGETDMHPPLMPIAIPRRNG
jgi:hypothetical protein